MSKSSKGSVLPLDKTHSTNTETKDPTEDNNSEDLQIQSPDSTAMENKSGNLIWVSMERLAKLEELERNLSLQISEAILKHDKNKLKKLHEKDKENPELVKIRIKRYNLKNLCVS